MSEAIEVPASPKPRAKIKTSRANFLENNPDWDHPRRPAHVNSMMLITMMERAIEAIKADDARTDATTRNYFHEREVVDGLYQVLVELAFNWRFIPKDLREAFLETKNRGKPLVFDSQEDVSPLISQRPTWFGDKGDEGGEPTSPSETIEFENQELDQ